MYFGIVESMELDIESILLNTNLPYAAQSERAHKTHEDHPRK